MKFNLKKLEKSAVIGLASAALVLPMAMHSGQVQVHAESLKQVEEDIIDGNYFDLDYSTMRSRMQLMIDNPALKHTKAAKGFFADSGYSFDGADYAYYVKHYKQLYSPYLKSVLPNVNKLRREMHMEPARKQARRHHVIRRRVRKPLRRKSMKASRAKKQLINRINRAKAQVRKDQRAMKKSRRKSAKRSYSKAISHLNVSIKKMNHQLRRMK